MVSNQKSLFKNSNIKKGSSFLETLGTSGGRGRALRENWENLILPWLCSNIQQDDCNQLPAPSVP